MTTANLIPFIRNDLAILFVGLNPASRSNENGHYFSVRQSFWTQLFNAGLIIEPIDKGKADDVVFGSTHINFNNWNFGITDIVTEIAESDSRKIIPNSRDSICLCELIKKIKPQSVVLLHNKVLKNICRLLNIQVPKTNTGNLGQIMPSIETCFFNIAFPHGNRISDESKVERYIELKKYLQNNY